MSDSTTILVSKKLKKELVSFKEFGRETYSDVIEKLIFRAKQSDESGFELSSHALEAIREAREGISKGQVFSSRQIKRELGF